MRELILIIWIALQAIAVVTLGWQLAYYKDILFPNKNWCNNEKKPSPRAIISNIILSIICLFILVAPLHFETILSKEIQIFNRDGTRYKSGADFGYIVRQSTWDTAVLGRMVYEKSDATISDFGSERTLSLCTTNSENRYYIVIDGDNSEMNISKRMSAGAINGYHGKKCVWGLVKKELEDSTNYSKIIGMITRASSNQRELTLSEKIEIFRLLLPVDEQLNRYGIQLVDVSTR